MSNQPYATVVDLDEVIDLYWDDPVGFAEDLLDFYPDEWQRAVMSDLAHHPRVSVRSGQGVGKTALEAVVCIWFICCRPYPKIVCTAPTRQQLMDVLWAEIKKWIAKTVASELLEWTKTRIYMRGFGERWFATARTATKPENMQGFHEEYMLFIVDEASGVADDIMEAIVGTLSGPENKLLMCGNPTRTSGSFYDSHHKDRADYRTHKVSSLDSSRTSKQNIEMLKRKYREDSDVYRVRVLGDFPKSEPDVFIPLEIVEASIMREVYKFDENAGKEIIPDTAELHLGVDVARFGDDETVITPRVGKKAFPQRVFSKQDTMVTTGHVLATAREFMSRYNKSHCTVKIDDDGVGGAVTDRLREIVRDENLNITIIDCHNGSAAVDSDHYDNWASESWATVRDLLKDGEIQLPNDDQLVAQLTTRKYTMTSKGKIQIESKKHMKKRKLPSPDRADSVVLAFVEPPLPPEIVFESEQIDISDLANAY